MGVIEVLKMQERREGREEGLKEKSYSVVKNLLEQMGASDEEAAKLAEVSIAFVKKVRRELASNK